MTRRAIIMIHGFRGTHHGLALIEKQLSGHEVFVPDLPGFAKGDSLAHYDLEAYVSWLREYIKSRRLSQAPVLVGHSFGSIICAAYAARYPDTISQLVLINPIGAPALEGPRAILTRLTIFYYWLGEKLPSTLAHRWLSSKTVVKIMSTAMAKTNDKKLRKFIHDQHLQYFSQFHSAASVSEGFKTSVSHSVRDFAADIPVPTLLIAGDRDDITPLEKQKELQKLFQNARLDIIQNVGHLTHYETPAEVGQLIQAFLRPS